MQNKKSIAIVSGGYFPVPAVKGGAVESIIENLINENEKVNRVQFFVYSCYEEKAKNKSDGYTSTKVIYVRIPGLIKFADRSLYWIMKNIFRKKKAFSYRYIFQRLYYMRKVAKKINTDKTDYLVFENHPTLLSVLKYKNNFDIYKGKYSYHIHNVVNNSFGNEYYLSQCNNYFGVSNYVNGEFLSFLKNDENVYHVLKNRIDEKLFNKTLSTEEKKAIKEKYGIPLDGFIILFTGRLSEEKGVKELLLSFNKISAQNVYLLIVGSHYFGSNIKSKFENELNDLSKVKSNNIKFTGFVNYYDMYKYYSIADIVVLPSIWDDPAPLTVIESIACHKCIITTYSGGIPEYVNEDNSIILNKESSLVENLYLWLEKLINNRELIQYYEREISKIAEKMTINSYYNDFVDIVEGD